MDPAFARYVVAELIDLRAKVDALADDLHAFLEEGREN